MQAPKSFPGRGDDSVGGERQAGQILRHDDTAVVAFPDLGKMVLEAVQAAGHEVAQQQGSGAGLCGRRTDGGRRGVQPPGDGVRITGYRHVHHQQVGVFREGHEFLGIASLVAGENDAPVSDLQPEGNGRYDAMRHVQRLDAEPLRGPAIQGDRAVNAPGHLDRREPDEAAGAGPIAGEIAEGTVIRIKQAVQELAEAGKAAPGFRARDGQRPPAIGEVTGFQQCRQVRGVVRVKMAEPDEIQVCERGACLAEAQERATAEIDQRPRPAIQPEQVGAGCPRVVRDGPAGSQDLDGESAFRRATVVSRPTLERAVLDSGRKTIHPDLQMPSVKGISDVEVKELNAEHCILTLGPEARDLKIGDKIELFVGYADFTTVLHDEFYAFRSDRLEAVWGIAARGKLR